MAPQAQPEAQIDHLGEVGTQVGLEERIVGQRRREHLVLEGELAVRQQHSQLRPRQAEEDAAPVPQRVAVREPFELAVEQPVAFQLCHQLAEIVQPRLTVELIEAEDPGLAAVVRQHTLGHVRSQLGEQLNDIAERLARLEKKLAPDK
jgi:hypothetical protein